MRMKRRSRPEPVFEEVKPLVSTCGVVRAAGIGLRSVLWLLHHAFDVVAIALSTTAPVDTEHDKPAFRPHFRVAVLAKLWAVGRETVRQLVMHERMW